MGEEEEEDKPSTLPGQPGRMTLAMERIDRLEETTDVRERPAEVDEAVALARLDMAKAVLTGPNAKYAFLLIAFLLGVPSLVLGSWLTGYGFQVGSNGMTFGAVPMESVEPVEPVAPQ